MSGITQYWRCWCSSLVVGGVLIASLQEHVFAQIIPDNTLPNNSIVTPDGNTFNITGGTQAGGNLFHSFREFSVTTGGAAYFNNAVDIQNIISRVTGGSVSNIDGLIRANGTANLFLINPNGIIFGQNASLNIGGSFVGTTASAIAFGNQGIFSASNPESSSSLLTINPSALLFNQIKTASIQNNSVAPSDLNPSSEFVATGLRVPDGKSLLLVGGDINMDGGALFAFGGRVELGGVAGAVTVGLNGDGNNVSLSFPNSVQRSDVTLSNGALVDVAGGDGGSIVVNARNLEMIGESGLFAGIRSGLGSDNTKAGNINVSASTLRLEGGAFVSVATFGAGKGGNLTVDAQDVQLIGGSADGRFPSGLFARAGTRTTGDAGDLTIKTDTLLVRDGAAITVESLGTGTAGIMTLNSRSIRLDNNALLTANTGSAKVDPNREQATININSENLIISRNSNISTNAISQNVIGGNININTDFLIAFENSDISANSANFRGGNVRIKAQAIFGTQFLNVGKDSTSEITASGASPEFSVSVEPNFGLLELSTIPVDTQVAQTCQAGGNLAKSSFTITGRGGLPPSPSDALNADAVQVDLITFKPSTIEGKSPPVIKPTTAIPKPIVEATGWVINAKEELELTANAPTTPHGSWQNPVSCRPS